MCPLTFLIEVSGRYWAKQRGSRECAYVLFPIVSLSAALWMYAQGPGPIPHVISLNLTFVLSGHIGAIPQLSGRIIQSCFVHI